MTAKVKALLDELVELSPREKLELIREVTRTLSAPAEVSERTGRISALDRLQRVPPVRDVAELAVDFWPEEESADEVVEYIYRQRREDRIAS